MRNRARILAFAAALALALGPAIAEARPGGGSSSGSRGSRSNSAPPPTQTAPQGGQTFNRTEAPAARPGAPATTPAATAPRPGTATPAPAGSRFGGGFMGGLVGGLLAAGLFGMLAGGGFFGGLSGLAGMLGFLLQIALIAGLVFLVVRLVRGMRRPTPALASAGAGPVGYARTADAVPPTTGYGGPMASGSGGGYAPAPATRPITIGATDFATFERTLTEVNESWTRRDMAALNRLSTPEMVRYFQQDMRDLDARGWRNETRDIRLEAGDLSEAWNEDGLDYATVAMRFSLVDVTYDGTGKVVEGDAGARQNATELWTFVRPAGGAWMLSAIQQTGR